MNNAVMNIHVQVFVRAGFQFSCVIYLGVELLNHRVNLCLSVCISFA